MNDLLLHYNQTCPYFGLPIEDHQDITGCCCKRDGTFDSFPPDLFPSSAQYPASLIGTNVPLHSYQASAFLINNNYAWASQYAGISTFSTAEQSPDVQPHPQMSNPVEYSNPFELPWTSEAASEGVDVTAENTFSIPTTTSIDHTLSTPHSDTQPPPSPSTMSLDDSAIGFFHFSGKLKCNHTRCSDRTFSRPAELRRHYTTTHAAQKPEFWCNVALCGRSAEAGGKPFRREDKLRDHVGKKHRGGVSRMARVSRNA